MLLVIGVIVWRGYPLIWAVFIMLTIVLYYTIFNSLTQLQLPWLIGAGVLYLIGLFLVIKRGSKKTGTTVIFLIVMAVALVAISFFAPKTSAIADNTSQPAVVMTETGQTTWKMAPLDYGNNRWFTDGIAEIQAATTKEEATKAAQVWLEKVKTDPNLLVGASSFFLKKDVDKASLTDENGYATDKAIQLVTELGLAIGTAQAITPAQAPDTGYNSGVENDTVVASESPGITGDRKAIQIVLANGETVWVLARCGNPVTAGKPGLPTGKTDNPTPPVIVTPVVPTPSTPPPTPETPPVLTPKDPSQDPYPQGNAPEGGGLNEDPGSGEYIPPAEMEQPPSTPYVPPQPPAADPYVPPIGSTPDPTPAPTPEPTAPALESPSEGYSPPPGL